MQIQILKGPDRVRRRPAVIFGDDGLEGTQCAVLTILQILTAECLCGKADKLAVTAHADGSLTVSNNGQGLWLGSPDSDTWQKLFCLLYPGELYAFGNRQWEFSAFDPDFRIPAGQYDSMPYDELSLCAVQCASAFMDVCVHRGGLRRELHFQKGHPVGKVTATPDFSDNGTSIRFQPDSEVFTNTVLPAGWLTQQLQQFALLIPNLHITYQEETDAGLAQQVFFYPAGAAGLLQKDMEPYSASLTAEGRERYNRHPYGARVQVDLTFCRDNGFIRCYHNQRLLQGGTHLERVIEELCKLISWQLDLEIAPDQLLPHLQLVLQTTVSRSATCWTSGARTAIANQMIADMAEDTLDSQFSYYVKQHRDALLELFKA